MLLYSFKHKLRSKLGNERLEILSIETFKPFVITSWYGTPNSVDLFSNIDSLLGRLDSENVEHVMGDMNCDLLSSDNIYARALLNVTGIYGLKQLTDEHARITPSAD